MDWTTIAKQTREHYASLWFLLDLEQTREHCRELREENLKLKGRLYELEALLRDKAETSVDEGVKPT
jgi:hypothetical protein